MTEVVGAMPGMNGRRFAVAALQRRLNGKAVPPFEVVLPDGWAHRFGEGGREIAFTLHLRTNRGLRALASLDEAAIGLAYLNDDLDVHGDFLSVLDLRDHFTDRHPIEKLWRMLRPVLFGRVGTDRQLVPRHYDHGDDFYFAFLDREHRLYSQALYTSEDESLERAAGNKLEYIWDVCRLERGRQVLDVGAGWGSFARYAASRGVDVTMLTISQKQYAYLAQWCGHHGLPARLEVVRENIYAFDGGGREPFDAVVILGVMEHLTDYRGLFERLDRLVRPGGFVYADFSATRTKYSSKTFTHRYVFEGNHSPVLLPQLLGAANASPFELIATHNDRHSYFLTLQAWARNLEAAHDEVAPRFGEATYRLFRTYLWAGAHNMQRKGWLESYRVVFQKSLGRSSAQIGVYRPV